MQVEAEMLPRIKRDQLGVQQLILPRQAWWIDYNCVLGAGASGSVYPGENSTGERVAIKSLSGEQAQATTRRDLDNVARLIGAELRHVIPVFDLGEVEAAAFIVMARADKSLQGEVEARKATKGPIDIRRLLEILYQIGKGLEELATRDILCHRDLKPGNVLHHEGEWKIADFGLAKAEQLDPLSSTVRVHATREYAAPEVWYREQNPDELSDIYSLGCIGYALLAGQPPFPGGASPNRQGDPGRTPEFAQLEGAELHSLLGRMLGKRSIRPRRRKLLMEVSALLGNKAPDL